MQQPVTQLHPSLLYVPLRNSWVALEKPQSTAESGGGGSNPSSALHWLCNIDWAKPLVSSSVKWGQQYLPHLTGWRGLAEILSVRVFQMPPRGQTLTASLYLGGADRQWLQEQLEKQGCPERVGMQGTGRMRR